MQLHVRQLDHDDGHDGCGHHTRVHDRDTYPHKARDPHADANTQHDGHDGGHDGEHHNGHDGGHDDNGHDGGHDDGGHDDGEHDGDRV